jgi:cytidylate kinase
MARSRSCALLVAISGIDGAGKSHVARAAARSQEGLGPEETVCAYRSISFPAQEIRFDRDRPRDSADAVLANDPSGTPPAGAVTPAARVTS